MDVAVVLVGNGPRQDDLDGGGEDVQAFTQTREVEDVQIELGDERMNNYKNAWVYL